MKEIFKNRNKNFVSDNFKIEIHSFCKNQSTLKHRIKWFSDKGLLYSSFKNHKKDLNIHWSYFFRVDKWSWYFSYNYLLSTNIIEWFCSKPKKTLYRFIFQTTFLLIVQQWKAFSWAFVSKFNSFFKSYVLKRKID